jgi:hypothetical protein
MKNTTIKSLNEYFAQSLDGDSFNSSNGVFKVSYRAYDDLSIPVGRGQDPSLLIKDSIFQTGDLVMGNVKGKEKKIKGEVVEVNKSEDGKFYIIKIQSFKNKKNYTLIPGSIQHIQDRGNVPDSVKLNIASKERNAQNLKFNGGNIIWGSMEGRTIDSLYADPLSKEDIDGPMGTGWKIKFIDSLNQSKTLFNSFVIDPINTLISTLRSNNVEVLKTKLKAAESYCFIFYHPQMKNESEELRALVSILFLEMKNENDPKKFLIQNFPEITGKSYGEVRDEQLAQAQTIINNFL